MFYPYFCVKRYLKHPTAKAIGLFWLMLPILNALIAMLTYHSPTPLFFKRERKFLKLSDYCIMKLIYFI
ncbi:hypothetical protein C2R49_06075 [Helicobacter pylori]|nr:hypothetical protein C2R49_06075 [Helicobacter pylori]